MSMATTQNKKIKFVDFCAENAKNIIRFHTLSFLYRGSLALYTLFWV